MANERVLVVDDEANMRESLREILGEEGYECVLAGDGVSALNAFDETVRLVITDAKMPGMDGFELIKELHERDPDLPVVMITAYGSMELAIKAMRAGAYDYITKPFDPERILHDVRHIVDHYRKTKENIRLKKRLAEEFSISQIVGESQQIREMLDVVRRVASTPSSVLIVGQSGTGKELVAKALHYLGDRASQPFVIVNCAAIPDTLLESELFGHKKGAFTDAVADKKGRFEEADGGTIFLDEIGDMSLSLQSKMLRVLQEREFTRIGETKTRRVNVRIVTATNKNLGEAIQKGEFREDLYFRINVINIRMPSLRERRSDIPMLVDHFIKRYNYSIGKRIKGITAEAMAVLMSYHWPGNIRELENLIERAVIFADSDLLDAGVIKQNLLHWERPTGGVEGFLDQYGNYKDAVDAFERELIKRAFDWSKGHFSNAAKYLGLSRHALRYQMSKLGLQSEEFSPWSRSGEAASDEEASP
jgi:DNA-binding NtrC family response regulator